jgi:Tol biopolymer transport system component
MDRLPAWALWILIGVGCGSVKEEGPADAIASDGPTPDAASLCDPLSKFSEPVPVGGLATSANEVIGSLSPDELTIYPWGDIGTSTMNDIYVATRAHSTDGFGMPAPLVNVDSDNTEADPWISPDGLTLFFMTNRDDNLFHLYVATRTTGLIDFGAPAPLSGIQASGANDRTPYVSVDGAELWFTSDRPGGLGVFDVWRAVKSGVGFANPRAVPEVSSTAQDFYPVLSVDKLTIYISSQRPGGMGNFDIWRARRSTTSDGFGSPEMVSELNTRDEDLATWLSPDGCRLYLRSTRNGTNDAFVASRSPP